MKSKLKQKRGEPIQCRTSFTISAISKCAIGWRCDAQSDTQNTSEPLIALKDMEQPSVFLEISKSDFDRLQPGDTIRFLAVVTRPRKVKIKNPDFSKDSASAIAAEVAG